LSGPENAELLFSGSNYISKILNVIILKYFLSVLAFLAK
jgi:hypothetical protein